MEAPEPGICEQTTRKGEKYILREGKDILPESLQNPADPDATYRFKLKAFKGYVVNVVAAVRDGILVVLDYQMEKNTYADVQFAEDTLKKYRECTFISDAAYGSLDVLRLCLRQNVKLTLTSLTGAKPKPIIRKFSINPQKETVVSCPERKKPIQSSYSSRYEMFSCHFKKGECDSCPHREECRPIHQVKSELVKFSMSARRF